VTVWVSSEEVELDGDGMSVLVLWELLLPLDENVKRRRGVWEGLKGEGEVDFESKP